MDEIFSNRHMVMKIEPSSIQVRVAVMADAHDDVDTADLHQGRSRRGFGSSWPSCSRRSSAQLDEVAIFDAIRASSSSTASLRNSLKKLRSRC